MATVTRKPSVSRLLAKRAAEDEKLRAALETMKAERAVLDERIREVEILLGMQTVPSVREMVRPGEARCIDCGVIVPVPEDAGERSSECPACRASPFEYTAVAQ